MRSLDFSPLFRTTVGFDRMAHLMDSLANEPTNSFPPYNIETTKEDNYRITMAVAGFGEDDIELTAQDAQLLVSGRINRNDGEDGRTFLHHGIAERAFERRFNLADHVVVKDARLENGLLHINLVREVPEEKKPRKIAIVGGNPNALEGEAA
jgi:molecular chaperone IbpA